MCGCVCAGALFVSPGSGHPHFWMTVLGLCNASECGAERFSPMFSVGSEDHNHIAHKTGGGA